MQSLFTPLRTFFLLLISGGLFAHSVRAQEFAQSVVPNMAVGLITDDYKAADKDITTAAVLKPTALLSSTSLRVAFKSRAKVGQPAGVHLKSANALNVEVVGYAMIKTYLGNRAVATYHTSNLLGLALGNSDATTYTFTPTEAFDQIEVAYYSLLAVGKDVAFYEAYITPETPLPVVLTAFEGKATSTGTALSWKTASELNSDHFVVERASSPAADFRVLGQVQAAGSSQVARTYQFVDATAPAGLSYYRLRQVDLDGKEAFSPVVVVQADGLSAKLAAYPSPATETLTIAGSAGARLSIFNQLGQQVQVVDMSATSGQPLDVRSLPAGTYFVRDAATGQSTRFVKAAASLR